MSVIPQTPRASEGLSPLCPLPGLCLGPAGDLKRSSDPSPTHAPLTTNPGSAPAEFHKNTYDNLKCKNSPNFTCKTTLS